MYSNECHNSVVGMREYALKRGATFKTIDSSLLHNNIDFGALSVSFFYSRKLNGEPIFDTCSLI